MKRSSPRKGRPYAILLGLAAVTVVALPMLLTSAGCGLQGEGQRCDRSVSATPSDPTTGNDDCDTSAGLVCVSKDVLGSTSDICCPANNGASENPNCQRSSGPGTGGAPATTATTVTSAGATTSAGSSTSTATSSSSSSSSASSSSASSSSASSSSSSSSASSSSSSGSGSSSSTGP